MKVKYKLTAVFEEEADGSFIAYVEEIAGVNSQGNTLAEARVNLFEALALVMKTHGEFSKEEEVDC